MDLVEVGGRIFLGLSDCLLHRQIKKATQGDLRRSDYVTDALDY
jgi:hypothetical protein